MRFFPFQQMAAAMGFFLTLNTWGATSPSYVNSGSVTNPIVDATSFLNLGYFETSTSVAYETSNTLNYTNRGTMAGSVGFRFHTFTNTAPARRRAANFVNEAIIRGNDPTNFFFFSSGFNGFSSSLASYIYIDASNIVNRGNLQVSASGLLRLTGNNIDLRGGALVASSPQSPYLDSYLSSNYVNEARITDLYWGVGTNNTFSSPGFRINLSAGQMNTNSPNFGSGFHQVVDSSGFTNTTRIPFFGAGATNYAVHMFSNPIFGTGTNFNVQAVFVSTNISDPDMRINVGFYPEFGDDAPHQVLVQFGVTNVDILSGQVTTNYLYFSDSTAVATLVTDLFYQDEFYTTAARPNPYDIVFGTPFEWSFANPSNTTYNPGVFYTPLVHQKAQPESVYAAQSVFIGSVVNTNFSSSEILNEPSNSVGRVEIVGDNVNVNLSRIQSEGLFTLTATNFQTLKEGTRVQAEQMRLNLTSTNQTFILTNILASNVKRIGGGLRAWSAVWTNNTATDEIRYHVLILDNQLTSTQPSAAYGFSLRVASNQPNSSIIIEDPVTVAREFFLDAENITIRDVVNVSDSITSANMPRVLNFTNEGLLNIPNAASFAGANGAYATFVNRSNIFANSISANTFYFQNTGVVQSLTGSISITNRTTGSVVDLASGTNISKVDVNIAASLIRGDNSVIKAGASFTNSSSGEITYDLGGLLFDANGLADNPGGTNLWSCFNGFRLSKINNETAWVGDLLNTELTSTIKPSGYVEHTWSGFDLGVTAGGFTNNAALGKLILDAANFGHAAFHGPSATGTWALYVDYLDLRNYATNWQTVMQLDSNFSIYFADCSVRPEKLDNVNNFHWVRNYTGRYSGTNVVINGQPTRVNRALYTSKEVDSDGDGITNADDNSPFDGVVSNASIVTSPLPQKIKIQWVAAPNTTYTVEYTTNLTDTVWTTLSTTTTGSSGGVTEVIDPISSVPRFYRVRYTP